MATKQGEVGGVGPGEGVGPEGLLGKDVPPPSEGLGEAGRSRAGEVAANSSGDAEAEGRSSKRLNASLTLDYSTPFP